MLVSVDMPDGMKKALENEVAKGLYSSRSEVIRDAVRHFLRNEGMLEEKELSQDATDAIREAREQDETIP